MLFQLLYPRGSNSTPMVEHSLATDKIWVRIPVWITCICVVTICRDWYIIENDSQNVI